MSEDPAQKTISLAQIDGRIAELERQRNEALTRAARIAGERDEALNVAQVFRSEVARLTDLLNRHGGSEPPATPNEPEGPLAPAGAAAISH